MMSKPSFSSPPPTVSRSLITFPTPNILLVTLNRPADLNCIDTVGSHELDALWKWYDNEPTLRCAVITGSGRAFCTGADLKEFHRMRHPHVPVSKPPATGFAGMSMRTGKKPIIAAVNGLAYGGGCEIVVNADIVLAAPGAKLAIPDVKIGTLACGGILPRLVLILGMQRATEMALTGRAVGATEAQAWGLVNRVVGEAQDVAVEGVEMARVVAGNSPDSVIGTREGLRKGWVGGEAVEVNERLYSRWGPHCEHENYQEGIRAFVEKRPPRWVDSKL